MCAFRIKKVHFYAYDLEIKNYLFLKSIIYF